jgi:inhibitor of cysteine peptidase
MDLISTFIRLLLTLFAWLVLGTSTSVPPRPPASQPGEETFRSPTNITSVDVIVMESFPMQVSLHVTGEQPDGCDYPVIVEQRREGNMVIVDVYREVPLAVMCPMILLPYDDTIRLDGTFEPGDYVFQVNDFIVEKTL